MRLRRLRKTPALRSLVQENTVSITDLVFPLFIKAGKNLRHPISSMPGHFQFSVYQLEQEISEIVSLKIPGVILFGIPAEKDAMGSDSLSDNGIIPQEVRAIKKIAPTLLVITDVCLCEYTDHGHCGVIENGDVDNDSTVELLAREALSHARAGADVVAPSGMMDGMVQAIRTGLDAAEY